MGSSRPCSYAPHQVANKQQTETETETHNRTMAKEIDSLNGRLTAVKVVLTWNCADDFAYLVVIVDEGFKRQHNWMKFMVGVFVMTTIVMGFTHADIELEKGIKGGVIALESRILPGHARMKLGLPQDARQGWGELGVKLRGNDSGFPMVFSPNAGVLFLYNKKGLGKLGEKK
ncbi:hypothetical protein HOY82DRAFT_599224 [Tuber indicum]|nr:hypothetical protein HOY82DRAFT_599224 [Tuber indicum]